VSAPKVIKKSQEEAQKALLRDTLENQQKLMMENFKLLMASINSAAAPTDGSNAQLGAQAFSIKEVLMQNWTPSTTMLKRALLSTFGTVASRPYSPKMERFSTKEKIKVLVRRLSNSVFDRLAQITSPESPFKKTFEEILMILKETFGSKETVFTLHYVCMHLKKYPCEEILCFLDKV
jgi:hypothetical protein